MINILKSKYFYQNLGVYYVVSVITVIVLFLDGGAHGWDTTSTYTMPFLCLFMFVFVPLIMFTHWMLVLIFVGVVILFSGTLYFNKKNTKKLNQLRN